MLKKTFAAEHHLTFTKEDGKLLGSYLTYREIPLVGVTGKLLAEETYNVLEEFNSTNNPTALLLDQWFSTFSVPWPIFQPKLTSQPTLVNKIKFPSQNHSVL